MFDSQMCDLSNGLLFLKISCLTQLHCVQTRVNSTSHLISMSSTAGSDVKDIFADARNGDQFRVLKIVIEDGKQKLPKSAATCDISLICVIYQTVLCVVFYHSRTRKT